jgi:hypothetical protein
MARLPKWAKLQTIGTTDKGNLGVRLIVRWWAVPFIWLRGFVLRILGRLEPVPDSCDGLEIVEVKIG